MALPWCGACRSDASDFEALYQQYKDSNFTVITLLGENNQEQPPSVSDLQKWASDYGLSHPVLSDAGFSVTAAYLWSNPTFTGSIFLPNLQLVSAGMVVGSQLSNVRPQIFLIFNKTHRLNQIDFGGRCLLHC